MTAVDTPIRVVVWGENVHEQEQQEVRDLYPDGMHSTIREGIEENLGERVVVRTATLQDPEHGLTEEVLRDTDVLVWWGHAAHDQVA
ncbi:MAG TPA: trehalose utilization protein ThuA, partial [Candidatus Microbacterium pullistercoris]|nr:trehalose utilization protein ThuA [Candidatus Microbacterium pullistercoris]